MLFSTIGRTAARCVETLIIADAMVGWLDQLQLNTASGDLDTWTSFDFDRASNDTEGLRSVRGAARLAGSLGADPGRPDRQLPGGGPDDLERVPARRQGPAGAYEAALVGVKLAKPDEPLEILRTIHSFDPCLACAVHLVDARGREIGTYEVVSDGGLRRV